VAYKKGETCLFSKCVKYDDVFKNGYVGAPRDSYFILEPFIPTAYFYCATGHTRPGARRFPGKVVLFVNHFIVISGQEIGPVERPFRTKENSSTGITETYSHLPEYVSKLLSQFPYNKTN
jgi:hypothetical protein